MNNQDNEDIGTLLFDELCKAINEEIVRELREDMAAIGRGELPPKREPSPEPLPNPGTLGIVFQSDGEYRVRGYGTEYNRFIDHAYDMIEWTGDDWPWSYFALKTGVTQEALMASFEANVLRDT